MLIIKNDKNLHGIRYNQLSNTIDVSNTLPWKRSKSGWTDSDMSALKVYIDELYGIWSPIKLKEAFISVSYERAYNPIKNFLNKLPPWDGIKRIDNLLIDYLGAENNQYSKIVIRKTLIAAVARIYQPGIKFDSILILNGPQGIGKSTLFKKLGGFWYSDSLSIADMRDKTAAEKVQGNWILELGELAGIKKMDVEIVKSFITRTDDKYRVSYGVNVENHPRQSIIVGTTNSINGFLRDITGNRRFWPVKVSGITAKKPWDIQNIDMIWAEALKLYNDGEDLYLDSDEEQLAFSQQCESMEIDEREGLVRQYLDTPLPEKWDNMNLLARKIYLNSEIPQNAKGSIKRQLVCSMEIWCECFGKDSGNLKKSDSYEISAIMSRIENWKPYDGTQSGTVRFPIYNKQRAYMRIK